MPDKKRPVRLIVKRHLTQMVGPDGYTQTFNYDLLSEVTNSFDAISSITNWFNNQGLLTSSVSVTPGTPAREVWDWGCV